MHLAPFSSLCTISCFALLVHALPLKPQEAALPIGKRVPYSVVAVDGGSSAAPPATITLNMQTVTQTTEDTTTITAPPSTLPPSTEIIISTKVVEESETATTVAVTVTKEPPTTPLPLPLPSPTPAPTLSPSSTTTPVATTSSPKVASPVASSPDDSRSLTRSTSTLSISDNTFTTISEAPTTTQWMKSTLTVAPMPPASTSTTFDNGMWHTYWNATSTTISITSQTAYSTGHVSAIP